MTITAGGDKIAPVADDGALKKPQEIMSAGDVEAEQPGMWEWKKGAGSAEKTDEKNCWQRLADVIIYIGCRLKLTERKADETEKKNKKVLDKAEQVW